MPYSIHHISPDHPKTGRDNLVAGVMRSLVNVRLFCRAYFDFHGMAGVSDWSLAVMEDGRLVGYYDRRSDSLELPASPVKL